MPNYVVLVRPDGQFSDISCLWACGIVSGLLGFKTSYLPPAKTRVSFYYTGQQYSFILGSYSGTMPMLNLDTAATDYNGDRAGDQKTHTTQQSDSTRTAAAQAPPIDMVEGEIDISNLMGVGITLLRHMASIQASDLARVECLLLDDIVRIISQNYRHHSSFGDFKISNDGGKLNVQWDGSSLDHEAWGVENPGDAKAKLENHNDHVNMTDNVDGYTDDGRWRFSQYLGWLGDFINVFVTDPVDALGRLAADQLRSGKARVHINNDGAVLIQSVADIVLEKVVRIPVPIRLRREEDPKGNRSDDSLRNQDQLAQWNPTGSLFEMAFQLREYSRWLGNMHSLARFRQMDRDFKVPTEKETPEPKLMSAEQDKLNVNKVGNEQVNNWRFGYACYRIYRDGSVQHVDAYGNSYTSTQTGIQISTTQDLLLQAAGSINIVAGRDINLLAKKNVGITAIEERIRLKAELGIWCLVQTGKFIVDFINVGVAFFRNAKLNVNNVLSTSVGGNLEVAGVVTGIQVAAVQTLVEGHHDGHVYPGFPAPDSSEDKFNFQESYGSVDLHQTHTQSTLDRGEQASSGSWALAGNSVSGRGAPWPGEAPTEKKSTGGQDLNQPSEVAATARPATLAPADIVLKVQV